jgi:hypothetical protein
VTQEVLLFARVPEAQWPEALMTAHRLPLGGKREVPATFGIYHPALPAPLIYQSEGMPAEARARYVADNYVGLAAFRIFGFLMECLPERLEEAYASSIREVEARIDRDLQVKARYPDLTQRIAFHARSQGLRYDETADVLHASTGYSGGPDAVRKSLRKPPTL